jgi:hypothetical protein
MMMRTPDEQDRFELIAAIAYTVIVFGVGVIAGWGFSGAF